MKKLSPAKPSSLSLKHDNTAMSPVIGAILLILLTVLLAGITVSAVYGKDYSTSMKPAPMAVIEIESVVGGVPTNVHFEENFIVLIHKGGAPLQADSTIIIVSGQGCSPTGVIGQGGSNKFGDIFIVYDSLAYHGKNSQYASRNQNMSDGVWSSGETVVLNGRDSPTGSAFSSVHVTIKGMSNTSNNYSLKQNSVITVKVFDRDSNKIIAEMKHKVTPAK